MTGRKQQISLAGGCWRHGIVVHEIGKLTTMLKLLLCGEEMLNRLCRREVATITPQSRKLEIERDSISLRIQNCLSKIVGHRLSTP